MKSLSEANGQHVTFNIGPAGSSKGFIARDSLLRAAESQAVDNPVANYDARWAAEKPPTQRLLIAKHCSLQ